MVSLLGVTRLFSNQMPSFATFQLPASYDFGRLLSKHSLGHCIPLDGR